MRFLIYWLFFTSITLFVRQSSVSKLKKSGTQAHKNSIYYNKDGRSAGIFERCIKVGRTLLLVVVAVILLVVLFALKSKSIRLALLYFGMFLILVSFLMQLFIIHNSGAVIDNDCDPDKALIFYQIQATGLISAKKKATYACVCAESCAIQDSENWKTNCDNYLTEARQIYPEAYTLGIYVNALLHRCLRDNDAELLKRVQRSIDSQSSSFLNRNSNMQRLSDECDIVISYLEGKYETTIRLIDNHLDQGDCTLACLYMHYILAKLYYEAQEPLKAAGHAQYLELYGSKTYYPRALREFKNSLPEE